MVRRDHSKAAQALTRAVSGKGAFGGFFGAVRRRSGRGEPSRASPAAPLHGFARAAAPLIVCVLLISGPMTRGSPAPSAFAAAGWHSQARADRFTSISDGAGGTCGVRVDTSLVCWLGDPAPPGRGYKVVSVGGQKACATRGTRSAPASVVCWGADTLAPRGDFVQVSVNYYADACGIESPMGRAGAAVCWQAYSPPGCGPRRPPHCNQLRVEVHRGPFIQVAAAVWSGSACAVSQDGHLECWGFVGAPMMSGIPAGRFLQVAVGGPGSEFACALRVSHRVTCWGDGAHGETKAARGPFEAVSTGNTFACGVRPGGRPACWGEAPKAPSVRLTQISAAIESACGLQKGGLAVCWGKYGIDRYVPGAPFVQVSVGAFYFGPGPDSFSNAGDCGLRADGSLTCFGWLGEVLPPAGRFVEVSVGNDADACALRVAGTVVCWAAPDTPFSPSSDAQHLLHTPAGRFVQVSTGTDNACGLRASGKVSCWGWYPSAPIPKGRFTQVAVGETGNQYGGGNYYACGLRRTGSVVCWGAQGISFGTERPIFTPPVLFTQLSAGFGSVCGLASDRSLQCWDDNPGDFFSRPGPYTQITDGCGVLPHHVTDCTLFPSESRGYKQVAAAPGGWCGVRLDGAMWCDGGFVVLPPAGQAR